MNAVILNVLRIAVNRLGTSTYRETGFKPFEIDAAKDWVQAAIANSPAGERSTPAEPNKYDDVLLPFLAMMRKELHANSGKGDRPGWLAMSQSTALLEVYWHVAKLSVAVKNNDTDGISEHGADVANMAMMVVDVCGALTPDRTPPSPQPKGAHS